MVAFKLVQKKKVGLTSTESQQTKEDQQQHGMGWLPSTPPPAPKTKPKVGGTTKRDINNTKPNIVVTPPIAPLPGSNEFGFPIPQKF